MKIAIPAECLSEETRVATPPNIVKKLIGSGFKAVVESGRHPSKKVKFPK